MSGTRTAVFNRANRSIVLVLIAGFVFRLAWLVLAQPEPVSDYQVYVRLAENLLDQRFFGIDGPSALWLPGFPTFLAALMLISRSVTWLSFVMVALSTAVSFLVYLLALRLTSRQAVALTAAGVSAVSPTFVLYSPVVGTEHLFVLLFLGSLLITLSLRPDRLPAAGAAGVITGLAILTRGEMVFYLPVLAAILWFGLGIRDRVARVRLSAVLAVAMLLVISPWIVRNAVVIQPGVNLSTVGGMNFYFGHRADGYGFTTDVPWPPGDDLAANRIGWEEGLAYVRERPMSVLESVRAGTIEMLESPDYALIWSTQEPVPGAFLEWTPRYVRLQGVADRALRVGAVVLLTLAAAAYVTWRSWPRNLIIVAVGIPFFSWVGHAVLFMGNPRFRYTTETILAILVAVTLVALREGA
ncbi:MAG: ArnT family glycosyltransferase, partial [Acidimicrobiia bacterium]